MLWKTVIFISGALNATAPTPVRNIEFTKTLGCSSQKARNFSRSSIRVKVIDGGICGICRVKSECPP